MRQATYSAKKVASFALAFALIIQIIPISGSAAANEAANSAPTAAPKQQKAGGCISPDEPAQISWNSHGEIRDGKLQVNSVAVDIAPRNQSAAQNAAPPSSASADAPDAQSPTRASLSAVASERQDIAVTLSQARSQPGSQIMVSGQFLRPTTAEKVYVLFDFHDYTRGLAEATIQYRQPGAREMRTAKRAARANEAGITAAAADYGSFSSSIKIPADALAGIYNILVVSGNDSTTMAGSASHEVMPPAHASISGVVKGDLGNGSFLEIEGAKVWLKFSKEVNGFPEFFASVAFTDNQGRFQFPNLEPLETYIVTPQYPSLILSSKTFTPQSGQQLFHEFIGKFPSEGLAKCEQFKAENPDGPPVMAQYTKPNPGFNIGTFVSMPGKGKPFTNTFTATLPFDLQPVNGEAVVFRFKKFNQFVKDTAATYNPNSGDWSAQVDMSEFPAGTISLQMMIKFRTGNIFTGFQWYQCEFSPSLEFTMVEVGWFNPWVTNTQVQVIKSGTPRYTFSGRLPNPNFNFNEPLDLELIKLDNVAELGIEVSETLKLDGAWQGQASAQAKVIFLDMNFLDEQVNYTPNGSTRTYSLPQIQKQLAQVCVPIFEYGFGIPEILYVGISVQFCVGGHIKLDSQIKNNLKVNARVTPGVTVGLPIVAEIDILICSGEVGVTPHITVDMPIYYDPDRNPIFGFDDPCVTIGATVHYAIECLWWTVASGSESIKLFQLGCGSASLSAHNSGAHTEAKASLAHLTNAPHGLSSVSASQLSPRPAVAANGAGQAVAMWLQGDAQPGNVERRLHYSFYDGSTWSAAKPVYQGRPVVAAPKVAYLDAQRALAVWAQSQFTLEDGLAGDMHSIEEGGELYYAIWDGQAWSAPAPITDDKMPDGRPSLAVDQSTGQAMLTWVHGEQTPDPEQHLTSIYYASFDGAEWSKPAPLSVKTTEVDYQPAVRFDRQGQPVAVWLRDSDGDLTTRKDRRIMLSSFDGKEWSAAAAIPNLPAGVYTPAMAFDINNNPLVVFVVPPFDKRADALGAGEGNQSQLFAAYRRGGVWESAPVGGGGIHAERPIVQVTPDNRAIIMFRRFGRTNDKHQSGDLASAVADLNAPAMRWGAGFLSQDGLMNWQTAFDLDPSTSQSFVVNVKRLPTPEAAEKLQSLPDGEKVGGRIATKNLLPGQTAVASFVAPYAADLTVGEITISNPHPLVGESVKLTAQVVNAGLKSASNGNGIGVRFYEGQGRSGARFLGEQRIDGAMSFNTPVEVSLPLTVEQGGVRNVFVVVDEDGVIPESDNDNNLGQLSYGQTPPPLQLYAIPQTEQRAVLLRWNAPSTKGLAEYQVFRSAEPGKNYQYIGASRASEFVDTLAAPNTDYYYVVKAVDVYSTRSAFSNEASAKLAP